MHIRFHPHRPRRRRARDRRGAILIWFALLLIILMAMAGMVIDVGRLMAAQRQAQNAADAAAMAVADDVLIQNRSHLAATTTLQRFVRYQGLPSSPQPVWHPSPQSGPHAGRPEYVEVVVAARVDTYLIHVLPGVSNRLTIHARAVAGRESVVLPGASQPTPQIFLVE